MKPAFVVSFVAAACVHALLLFGFRLGTPALPLPVSDDPTVVDVSLVAAAPEALSVAPPPPEPTLPPPPATVPPPVPPQLAEITPPAPPPVQMPPPTAVPQPNKPRPVVPRPARMVAPGATQPAQIGGTNTPGPAATVHARYRSNPKPAYPSEARNLRQEGVVMLSVQVGADGRVLSVSLQRSSGHSLLDQAAIRGVQGWTFEPARSAGVAVASRVDVPIRFSLMGR